MANAEEKGRQTTSEESHSVALVEVQGVNGEDENETAGFLKNYTRIFSYTDSVGWLLNGLALIGAISAGCALPMMDLLFGKVVSNFNAYATGTQSASKFQSDMARFALYFVYLFIAKFVLAYIWTFSLSISAMRTTKALRVHFLAQLLRQDIAFFDSNKSGPPSVQVTTNANLVNQGISEKLGFAVQGTSTFVAAFVVAFAIQWKLTLITICIAPIILVVTSICAAIYVQQENKIMGVNAKAGAVAEEVLSSMKTVHAFSAFSRLSAKYDAFLQDAKRLGLKQSLNFAIFYSTEFFCVYAGYGLAFWQGVRMYARGEIKEPGGIVTVIFAIVLAATAMTQIAPQIMQIAKGASAAGEMFKVIDRVPLIDSLSDSGERPEECTGNIQFSQVSFFYPSRPHVPVLKGLDLSIPASKTTALVGGSGSGKSTVTGLLERWYEPSSGCISLDGRDIKELNIKWLRTNIRIVQQEPTLFNGTIFENVAYGLVGTKFVNSSKDDQLRLVVDACKAAYAHDFVEKLPEGYQTQVGERAAMLSGGQKQRIAIARSIVSDPKVLILDEATSALDPKAEKIVQEALDNVSSHRTTLVIAHKLSTIKKADQIVVMSKGEVVEKGTHDELNAAGGAYHRLIKAQDLGRVQTENSIRDKSEACAVLSAIPSTQKPEPHVSVDSIELKSQRSSARDRSLIRCLAIFIRERRELWWYFLVCFVTCLAGGACYPILAFVFAKVLDVFQIQDHHDMIKKGDFYALMFFVMALAILLIYGILGWLTNIIATNLVHIYRLEVFNSYLRQDMAFYDQPEHTTGALASRLSTEPTYLQELIGMNVGTIFIAAVNVVSSSALSIAVGWKLGLVVLAGAMIPMVFCGYLRVRLEFLLDERVQDRFADSAALASEAVSAIRTVASLAMEETVLDRYRTKLEGIERRSIKFLIWTMFWLSLTQSLSLLSEALSFWYGGRLYASGEYSTTQLYLIVTAVVLSGEGAAAFFSFTTSLTKGQAACNYILWLRSLIPNVKDGDSPGDPGRLGDGAAHVECENLEFRYPTRPDRPILRTINAEIYPGQVVAFVGPSGHGKSSLVSLLERYYNPVSGCIKLDGTDISTISLKSYRSNLALVQQEPTLYQGTIRENIALGLESDATDDQIVDACRQANIYDFVQSLPDGLATMCGSRGTLLSGGQRQRIAIARALTRKPRLLLLDEATSALDTESERIVQAALDKAKEGRTTITIAHRLSTIKDADQIFVLVDGKIAERGTHEELVRKKGIYYEMCLGQALDKGV